MTRSEFVVMLGPLTKYDIVPAVWCPLPLGWLKINIGVFIRTIDSTFSALVRNSRGEVIWATTNIVNFIKHAIIEATVLLAGIRVAMDKRLKCVMFECDCASIVHGIQGSLDNLDWNTKTLLQDC
ncbi:hypothetical protein PanWU01x14_270640 [Parasponia andersonii]|uniref:RNase H type-1 domain-containing protein n=1 Tax=Parasponia andersonii TaxID=3476 RepID=A0A2P5B4Z0_PARAD|nr:hypothetical protein PanWU01x14_270640 [Parasponia andersonii]